MNKLLIALGILLALSIGGNIFFLSGKGIVVNNNHDMRQFQNQSQSQIVMNWFQYQGEWKPIIKQANMDELTNLLGQLNPVEYTLMKIVFNSSNNSYILVYPEVSIEWKQKEKVNAIK